jgi:4-hydroxy-3-methylbut-2-enyl diphosphate reductase
MGLRIINHEEFMKLSDCKVLVRAHGEPPETYTHARDNRIEIIDGTCPIVLRLQSRIKKDFHDSSAKGVQVVILAKQYHASKRGCRAIQAITV